jgi:hypothetical protein
VRQGVSNRELAQRASPACCHSLVLLLLPWYTGTTMRTARWQKKFVVERVQTGVRMEKRLLKVLKALAEFHDLTLGDLLEGIVLHAFDGKAPFQRESRKRIKQLKRFYGLDLNAHASHRLTESREVSRARRPRAVRKRTSARRARTKAERVGAKKGRAVRSVRSVARRRNKKGGVSQ